MLQLARFGSFPLKLLSSSQKGLDVLFHLLGVNLWLHVLHDLSLGVYEEFCEVPGHIFDGVCLVVVERRVASEVVEDGVSVGAIHLDLLEDGESALILLPDEGLDLLRGSWFLRGELVARESEDLESFLRVLLIQGAVFVVVVLRETSLRCNISLE